MLGKKVTASSIYLKRFSRNIINILFSINNKHSYKFPSYFRKQSLLSAKPKFNTKNFVLPIKLKKVSLFTHN